MFYGGFATLALPSVSLGLSALCLHRPDMTCGFPYLVLSVVNLLAFTQLEYFHVHAVLGLRASNPYPYLTCIYTEARQNKQRKKNMKGNAHMCIS
jgi:hypothetical protein